jgi:dienelactone hydrolase
MATGAPVKTPEDWKQRREEIRAMLLHYEYGQAPPPPANLRAEIDSSEAVFDGAAQLVRLTLRMGPDEKVQMQAAVYVPAGGGRKPVLLAIEPVWDTQLMPAAQQAVQRGYLFAGYRRQDLDPDDEDRSNGVHPLYPDYDWATLAVWAWGASRVVDYLDTRDDVDTSRIALMGHSRAGKTALLAAALDDRIALAAPHGSGAGGAGSFRICQKNAETLFLITDPKRFHYWFQPRLRDFAGKEDRLPFDQHFLRALVAPRALVSMDGLEDLWANPSGTALMWTAAQPVFDLLGAADRNVAYFRPGGHDTTEDDWTILLDYCDHFLFGKTRPAETQRPASPPDSDSARRHLMIIQNNGQTVIARSESPSDAAISPHLSLRGASPRATWQSRPSKVFCRKKLPCSTPNDGIISFNSQ